MPAVMKISPQGQIRIPIKIMNALGITKGDYVEVDVKDSKIILKPIKLIDLRKDGIGQKNGRKWRPALMTR